MGSKRPDKEPSLFPQRWNGKVGHRSIRGQGPDMTLKDSEKDSEYLKCSFSPGYFIDNYCWIEDQTKQMWLPFVLWPAQWGALQQMVENDQTIVVKARRLGLTWLCIAHDLWQMIFRPGSACLFFSRTDKEAVDLLDRLRRMHQHLPHFLQASIGMDNAHELEFAKLGSRARAFASTEHSGRSYEASTILVDEADFIPVLDKLLVSLKPCIEGGGRMRLVSSTDKEEPASKFKTLARSASAGRNAYHLIFLPWTARPGRTQQWYNEQVVSGDYDSDDMLHEFPASLNEALAPRSASKRFRPEWLDICSDVRPGREPEPGLTVWEEPDPERGYVISVDPSEGNPHSNPSPAIVWDAGEWAQVAVLYGAFEPEILAGRVKSLAERYNGAVVAPERNNHGHSFILAMRNLGGEELLYISPHDEKFGWLSTPRWKVQAMDVAAEAFRLGDVKIRDEATMGELMVLDGRTLKAPQGMTDDLAMATVIGLAAMRWPTSAYRGDGISVVLEQEDILAPLNYSGW